MPIANTHQLTVSLPGTRLNYDANPSLGKVFELDLSDFNYPLNDFEGFLKALEAYELEGHGRQWAFEETLLYLRLPDLGRINENYRQIFPELFEASSRRTRFRNSTNQVGPLGSPASRIIFRFLKWLLREKHVKSIKELNIPDDHEWPLSESLVKIKMLQEFDVQVLDWRKLDLDLRILTEYNYASSSILKNLTELKLYSSGNWGTLYHWASKDGLLSFPNVRTRPLN